MESPELEKVVLPDLKKRPKEALFMAWKNTFQVRTCNVQQEIAPNNLTIPTF